ncbi:MAG: hypothetical protein M3335_10995 [Actinomycetota bacterium]|nr:hypothetical protein [Actinomycetota bacterium]
MKHLKTMALAAIAAFGLLAFIGVSSASADIYTDSKKTVKYKTGTTLSFSLAPGKSSVWRSGSSIVATCTGGSIHGKTENETGTVGINVESETWTGCSQTTHVFFLGRLLVSTSGTVGGWGTQITFGIYGTSCAYGTGEGAMLGTLTSGSPARLKINAPIPRTGGGFLCPTSVTWEAEYVVTSPHSVYVG